MQLRRFTAESTPAALGAVRLELGDDAIILANRKIGDMVEIIATAHMEDAEALAKVSVSNLGDSDGKSVAKKVIGGPKSSTSNLLPATGRSIEQSQKIVNRDVIGTANLLGDASSSLTHQSTDALTIDQLKAAIENLENKAGVSRGKIDSAIAHQLGNKLQDDVQGSENTDQLEISESISHRLDSEHDFEQQIDAFSTNVSSALSAHNEKLTQIIESQNDLINQHFKGLEVNLWGNNAPNRRQHLQQLLSLGLGAELAVRLVERSSPEYSVDDALRHSFALLKSTLPIGIDKTSGVPGVTVVSGPPGAGKTTVLMKLATQHVKEHGADSIVVICADVRRIGAFEELQAYGRLLGVPTVHAHDTTEFESLITAFNHKQLVLVDHTLPMDADAVGIPKSLLEANTEDAVRQLLVLSATSQTAMIEALIERHCQNARMQCVLTHLDANARLGELFNPIIRHHIPIAYWSDAASIQTPLQKADASILIATAVAMSRRLTRTSDDECLLRLIQPTDSMMSSPVRNSEMSEVSA